MMLFLGADYIENFLTVLFFFFLSLWPGLELHELSRNPEQIIQNVICYAQVICFLFNG